MIIIAGISISAIKKYIQKKKINKRVAELAPVIREQIQALDALFIPTKEVDSFW